MNALGKPSKTVGMKKGLEAVQTEPVQPVARATDSAVPSRPPKPIRVTIDLDADRYRTLQAFRGTQITAAAVFRAFLDELEDSNDLAARISARIWASRKLYGVRRLVVNRAVPRGVALFAGQHQMPQAPAEVCRFPGRLTDTRLPTHPGFPAAEVVPVRAMRRLMGEERRHDEAIPVERAF